MEKHLKISKNFTFSFLFLSFDSSKSVYFEEEIFFIYDLVKLIKKKKKFLHSSLRFLWIYINKASLRLIFTVSPLRANEYRGKMSRIADTALNLRTQFYLNVHVAEGMRFWGNEELQITCTESCASRRYPRPSYSSNFFNYSVHLRINISCFKQCTFLVTLR